MSDHNRIRILPEVVATKIGAGEVVERPANAVKELMENAIDAGAKHIKLIITAGGRKLISVEDDGCGMDPDDLLQCLEQHATSKIRDVADIGRIDTYGFRGEAIPSIASVSRMKLSSRAEGFDYGKCIEVDGGTQIANNTIGFPGHGTTIEVRDLFYNMPARRKFLSSYYWEGVFIERRFLQQALSHPEIAMSMRSDGKDIYTLPAGSTLEERIHSIFNKDFISHLLNVSYTSNDGRIQISGYIGDPSYTKSDASGQYIFINKRAATADIIAETIRDTYPKLDKRKPVLILFIDVPPTELDVNISPTKARVKFCRKPDVRNALVAAISNALMTASREIGFDVQKTDFTAAGQFEQTDSLCPPSSEIQPPTDSDTDSVPNPERHQDIAFPVNAPSPVSTTVSYDDKNSSALNTPPSALPHPLPPTPDRATGVQTIFNIGARDAKDGEVSQPASAANHAPVIENPKYSIGTGRQITVKSKLRPWSWVRVLGRLNNGYVLMDSSKPGFIILDPQAAHECILYEDLLARTTGALVAVQPELHGYEVNLEPEDAKVITKHLDALKKMGFDIEKFDSITSFKIDALPSTVPNNNIAKLLSDIAANIKTSNVKKSVRDIHDEFVIKAVAKAAVKLNTGISIREIEQLVEKLASSRNPYISPSGKPTMIEVSTNDIDRKFDKNR